LKIILLPKKEDVIQIQQYRPICLLNVIFKAFMKVGTERVSKASHLVVNPTQTTFYARVPYIGRRVGFT
jgi:hypothetical protein